jgi:LacI family transcriptional regulator
MTSTINDVALKTKMARTTVSDILNRGKDRLYSRETVERVTMAARELGYEPNHFARSLKTGKTNIVGITSITQLSLLGFKSPYFSDIYLGVGDVFTAKKYKLIFHNYSTKNSIDELCELARKKIVDGLIIILFSHQVKEFVEYQVRYLTKMHFPFVLIHSLAEQHHCPQVGYNSTAGGSLAAGHLLEHGYKFIGLVTRKDNSPLVENILAGYRQALAGYGQVFRDESVFFADDYTVQAGHRLAEKLLAQKTTLPRALVAVDDGVAYGMMEKFRQSGLQVPQDVAMISLGSDINETETTSDLTVVRTMGLVKGQKAAGMLLELIDDPGKLEDPPSIIVPPELMVRTSCGCQSKNI